jgi:hypothetical protein
VPDPDLRLPDGLSEQPTEAEARAALDLITELLDGFEFKSAVDRAVALSLLLTVVCRGSMPTAPVHLIRATNAGTGKSYLIDIAAALATGRICPVTTAGKTPEESEKKLGAMLREGMPIIALDNCTYDLATCSARLPSGPGCRSASSASAKSSNSNAAQPWSPLATTSGPRAT